MTSPAAARNPVAWVLLALVLAVTALVYLPALNGGFVFDDDPNIVAARGVHWTALSVEHVRGLFTETQVPRRAVSNLSLALNHLVGGLAPRGYHVVNLVIHLLVGLALAWLLRVYLWVDRIDPVREAVAVAVPVAVFLLHPLNTQAVANVVQRMASLAALFSLVAMAAYLSARGASGRVRRGWLVVAVASWLLALGSKETALAVPAVLVVYEWCFDGAEWRMRLARLARVGTARWPVWVIAIGLALVSALLAVGYVGYQPISLVERWAGRDFNGIERMLTQPRVQFLYVGLLLYPHPSRLNLDWDVAVSRGLLDPPATLPAIVFWLVVVTAAVWLAARRPRYGFPLLAYLAFHLIEAGPINLEMAYEHRMYLPMTFLALLLGAVLADLRAPAWKAVAAVSITLTGPLGAWTWQRSALWADTIAFHQDVARKSPGKFRPQYNLGTILGRAGRVVEAIPPLERAVALQPGSSEARNQLGNAFLIAGRAREAEARYREAVELHGGNVEAVYNLAMVLDRRGNRDEAERYFRRFIELAPASFAAQVNAARRRLGTSQER